MSEILDTKAFSGYTHSDSFRCLENLPRMSSDLFLCYCGWERTTPLQLFAPVERRNHVIHFVLSGKGKQKKTKTILRTATPDITTTIPMAMKTIMMILPHQTRHTIVMKMRR